MIILYPLFLDETKDSESSLVNNKSIAMLGIIKNDENSPKPRTMDRCNNFQHADRRGGKHCIFMVFNLCE